MKELVGARTLIYMRPELKVKLIRKAEKYNVSLSKLLVNAALQYEEESEFKARKRGE